MWVQRLHPIIVAISLACALPAFAEPVQVWGLLDGTLCMSASGEQLSKENLPKEFPVSGERIGTHTVRVGSCDFEISTVALKQPRPCPGATHVATTANGGRGLHLRRGAHRSLCTH